MSENNKFEKICFCCLTEDGQMRSMLDELVTSTSLITVQLIEGYSVCTGIILDESIKKICDACEQKLKSSYEFRELCRASYQSLKEKTEFIPDLFVDVKYEAPSDHEHEIVYNNLSEGEVQPEPGTFNEVFIKNEHRFESKAANSSRRKVLKSKRKKANKIMKTLIAVPEDVEASDLESDFVCFHCDIVLPTHREYLKHYDQHKIGNGYPRIHRVCDICQENTKAFTRHIMEKHKDYKPFKCKFCVKAYQTPGELKAHLSAHASGNYASHKCMTCHETFKRDNFLRTHIYNHKNPDNLYFCPNCGLTFGQFSILNEHFQLQHDPSKTKNMFPCYRCKKIYMVKRYFDDHECAGPKKSKNLETDKVNCERCSTVFESRDEFVCHQFLGCRETQPHYCKTCDKTFQTKNKLQKHINATHVQKLKLFICDVCGHGSVDEFRYNMHKASHETERKFKCQKTGCRAAFKHIQYLRNHHIAHEEKPYACDICKKRFLNYSLMRHHMATHSDSSELRRFACELCGKRSATSGAHSRHMLGHTGEMNVKCKVCPKKFPDIAKANLHYRKYHEGIYWQCKFCDVSLKEAVRFRQHLFVHRGFKPYNCAVCPMQYTDKFLFKRHLLKQHNIVFNVKIHGYIEKENLDALVKECERKNYADVAEKKAVVQKATTNAECSSTTTSGEAQYSGTGGYMNWGEVWTKNE